MDWLVNQSIRNKKKLLLALFIALVMEFFIGVTLVFAQVPEPIFTNDFAQDLAGTVTQPADIVNFFGQNYYVATTTFAVDGCEVGQQLRSNSMQWFGSSFSYLGGGSSVSCPVSGNFYEINEPIFINLLTETDGFYCQITGTTTPTVESTIANRLCVEIQDGGPPILYDPQNLQDNIIDPEQPQLNFNTRFINGVVNGLSSTTINFDIDYFLETSEYTANTRPDMVQVQVTSNSGQVALDRRLILPLTDGTHSVNVPVNYIISNGGFPDGEYYSYVNFWNINIDSFTFSEAQLIILFEVLGGSVSTSTVVENLDGINLESIDYVNCSITNLSGCFQNALIYVFVPNSESLNKFTLLYERIEKKPPFGYVTSVTDTLKNISTTTSAFSFGNIPFQSQFFEPFKILIALGLWGIFIFYFMGRLSKLDI